MGVSLRLPRLPLSEAAPTPKPLKDSSIGDAPNERTAEASPEEDFLRPVAAPALEGLGVPLTPDRLFSSGVFFLWPPAGPRGFTYRLLSRPRGTKAHPGSAISDVKSP